MLLACLSDQFDKDEEQAYEDEWCTDDIDQSSADEDQVIKNLAGRFDVQLALTGINKVRNIMHEFETKRNENKLVY